MDRPQFEVADVFRRYGEAYRQEHGASLSMAQRRVMTAIEVCRTAVLGGHLEQCDHCGHQRNAYNSCADRHCPNASPSPGLNGSRIANPSSWTPSTSTWSSLYQNRLQQLPIRIRGSSTA